MCIIKYNIFYLLIVFAYKFIILVNNVKMYQYKAFKAEEIKK